MTNYNCTNCDSQITSNEQAMLVLEKAGVRATAPRIILLCLLHCKGTPCHMTAEKLYEKSIIADSKVSLATVYNTLRTFTAAGILREVNTDSSRVYFDTNVSDHHHFYNERTGELADINENLLQGIKLPPLPAGSKLQSIDLMIRIRS